MSYDERFAAYKAMTEQTLESMWGGAQFAAIPPTLRESMRYSLMAGGKRLRPVLLLATCDMLGGSLEEAKVPAAALEMIHTYSLIHDDLPGMDDDDTRRGRPTNHKVFGIGPAILAGDGLLNAAYESLLSNALAHAEHMGRHVRAIEAIARRAGVCGMIAGQSIDLQSEHATPDAATLRAIHTHKTADLLTAPLEAAAYLSGADEASIHALVLFGQSVGMAFQIADDVLDVVGDPTILGKQVGQDESRGKMTWPSLVGLDGARAESARLWAQATAALSIFGERAEFLRTFATRTAARKS